MAFSKKKRRKIVVDEKEYFWIATGNDDSIDLCISSEIEGRPKLLTGFDYHYAAASGKNFAKQFVVTPAIVRQARQYALAVGWKPFEKGKDLELQVDDKIDMDFERDRRQTEENPQSKI